MSPNSNVLDGANVQHDTIPALPPSSSQDGERVRPKKPPPITPKRFRKFFTPRSSLNAHGSVRTSRQALQDITLPAVNRHNGKVLNSKAQTKDVFGGSLEDENSRPSPGKRRRVSFSSAASSLRSSPIKHVPNAPSSSYEERYSQSALVPTPACAPPMYIRIHSHKKPMPIRRSKALTSIFPSVSQDVHGSTSASSRGRGLRWERSTANFFSRPDDVHNGSSTLTNHLTLPFCTTSCHTNSLVAVGDEEGCVRLLETTDNGKVRFNKVFLSFQAHHNAIMDMEFSSDDTLLATASGDQSARVTDMMTQTQIFSMSGHISSVKKVQFQPGSGDKVVATCSRDGSIKIWDLRCPGSENPSLDLRCPLDREYEQRDKNVRRVRLVNGITSAHGGLVSAKTSAESDNSTLRATQVRREDVSVTSLAFLKAGREHLLATGSEANACVKLWDLRTTYNGRRGRPAPVSTTRQPESHRNYRQFGLTSLVFGGDGARLYAVCRDSTIYAYATSHLILGHAPEMQETSSRPRRSGGFEREGLGPIYGFRHPHLHASTFYVKAAIRPAQNDKDELLAVGSSDNCAILFPTDESMLSRSSTDLNLEAVDKTTRTAPYHLRPPLRRTESRTGAQRRLDAIPIYQQGTPLVRGHRKEVTSLAWTCEGNLATVSDDFHIRCWRDGRMSDGRDARDLRRGGETEGRRWQCGWADVDASFDDDDGE